MRVREESKDAHTNKVLNDADVPIESRDHELRSRDTKQGKPRVLGSSLIF